MAHARPQTARLASRFRPAMFRIPNAIPLFRQHDVMSDCAMSALRSSILVLAAGSGCANVIGDTPFFASIRF
jgi:hypothetical protein